MYKKLIRFLKKLESYNYQTGKYYCKSKFIRNYVGRFLDYRVGKDYNKILISPQELIINLYHASTDWGQGTYAGENGLWKLPESEQELIKFRSYLLDTADMIHKYELNGKDAELPNNKQGSYTVLSDLIG